MTNEALCAVAIRGDRTAANALIERNLPFIRKTAQAVWHTQKQLNLALSIDVEDLVQEGSMALLHCISAFDPQAGSLFLTYAAPAIRNAIIDHLRSQLATFEAKNLGNILRIDEHPDEDASAFLPFVPISETLNPERICIAKETHEELCHAFQQLTPREQTYLRYRFGLDDDTDHPLAETANHFRLTTHRAKATEALAIENLRLELPWWY